MFQYNSVSISHRFLDIIITYFENLNVSRHPELNTPSRGAQTCQGYRTRYA